MAQYKVPQDVEADDKLLGPFSFRQFVYLMIAGALIAMSVGLFQLFPLLAIIPLPPVFFFLALALPLKKDQPMETYLAAMLSYYTKSHTRTWQPGQRGVTIQIMAPKKVEESRTRDITGEEATHRLSFLADIMDTEGYAIKGISTNPMREDLMAEASTAVDMFEGTRFTNLASTIEKEEVERHEEVVKHMQETIQQAENANDFSLMAEAALNGGTSGTTGTSGTAGTTPTSTSTSTSTSASTGSFGGLSGADEGFAAAMAATGYAGGGVGNGTTATVEASAGPSVLKHPGEHKQSDVVVMPEQPTAEGASGPAAAAKSGTSGKTAEAEKPVTKTVKASIIELANNDAFSVATIAEQAKRIKRKEEGEVFISLH